MSSQVFVVLRPENLLPVKAYLCVDLAKAHAVEINGEVAPVDVDTRTSRGHDNEAPGARRF